MMDWLAESFGRAIFLFALSSAFLWHMLNRHSPEVAGAAKQAATRKAIGLIARLFK
jgi:hypothetical protein